MFNSSIDYKKEIDKSIKKDKEFVKRKNKRLKKFAIIILIEMWIVSVVILSINEYNPELVMGLFIVAICYIFITGIVCYSIYSNADHDLEVRKKEIDIIRLKEYNEAIEIMYNDIRSFKHDYINIFSSMIAYMEEEDFQGLKEYFNNNIIDINEQLKHTNTEIAKLSSVKVKEIKGLIATKLLKAQKEDIDFRLDILDEIDNINMSKLELSRCIGILLDNAIEAASLCKNKQIDFGIIKNENSISIIISNSFEGELPPIHKLFIKGFSTKGENRGIGLSYVKSITTELENVFLDIAQEDNQVVVFLEIINDE
ncbi:MAG: GHKL domain-containing protein [Clostridium sp.]